MVEGLICLYICLSTVFMDGPESSAKSLLEDGS